MRQKREKERTFSGVTNNCCETFDVKIKLLKLIHKESKKKLNLNRKDGMCIFESCCLVDDKFIEFIVLFLCLFVICINQEHCV